MQAYSAGLVEGFLTSDLLQKHWNNLAADYCKGEESYCKRLASFLQKNLDFINSNVKTRRQYNVYWHQEHRILAPNH
ncbi:putative phospholipase B-like 2, partial [Stegodyphus mimosarum]